MTTFTPEPTTKSLPPAPVNLTIHEDTEAESAREESFSAEFHWNDQLLQPLSLERYNVFVSQRLAMAAPTLGQALKDGAAFFPDALRLLWLCSQPSAVISRLRANPAAMQDAIEGWAAEHAPVHRSGEILDLGINLFNSAFESRHESRASRSGRALSGN
jgi:hypothetical protein